MSNSIPTPRQTFTIKYSKDSIKETIKYIADELPTYKFLENNEKLDSIRIQITRGFQPQHLDIRFQEDNDEFTHFVETWLQDWVGYVEETVFDVNVLVLDEHHVCINNMNPTVIEFLKKHKMEPIHIPWR